MVRFLWGWGNGVVCGIQGTVKGCGSSADGVMGMVMGMKGTVKGCGSSWNRVIVMKGTGKGCGSSGDGVTRCGQRDKGYWQTWLL